MQLPRKLLASLRAGALSASLLLAGCADAPLTSQPRPNTINTETPQGQKPVCEPEPGPLQPTPPVAPESSALLELEPSVFEWLENHSPRDPCPGCGRG